MPRTIGWLALVSWIAIGAEYFATRVARRGARSTRDEHEGGPRASAHGRR